MSDPEQTTLVDTPKVATINPLQAEAESYGMGVLATTILSAHGIPDEAKTAMLNAALSAPRKAEEVKRAEARKKVETAIEDFATELRLAIEDFREENGLTTFTGDASSFLKAGFSIGKGSKAVNVERTGKTRSVYTPGVYRGPARLGSIEFTLDAGASMGKTIEALASPEGFIVHSWDDKSGTWTPTERTIKVSAGSVSRFALDSVKIG